MSFLFVVLQRAGVASVGARASEPVINQSAGNAYYRYAYSCVDEAYDYTVNTKYVHNTSIDYVCILLVGRIVRTGNEPPPWPDIS